MVAAPKGLKRLNQQRFQEEVARELGIDLPSEDTPDTAARLSNTPEPEHDARLENPQAEN